MSDIFGDTYRQAVHDAQVRSAESNEAAAETDIKKEALERFYEILGTDIEAFNAYIDLLRQGAFEEQVLTRQGQNGHSAYTEMLGVVNMQTPETSTITLPAGQQVPSVRLRPRSSTNDNLWEFEMQAAADPKITRSHTVDFSHEVTAPVLAARDKKKRGLREISLEDRLRDYLAIAVSGNLFRNRQAKSHIIKTRTELDALTAKASTTLKAMGNSFETWNAIVSAMRDPELNPVIAEAAAEARLLFGERATQQELEDMRTLKDNPRAPGSGKLYLPGKDAVGYLAR